MFRFGGSRISLVDSQRLDGWRVWIGRPLQKQLLVWFAMTYAGAHALLQQGRSNGRLVLSMMCR